MVEMPVPNTNVPWLLLTFTLPAKRASDRVKVWRKLQRYGSVPLGNSGYLLPNDAANQERFEWLATAIRKYGGDASVVQVQAIDNLSTPQLIGRFAEARARDYQEVIQELQRLSSLSLQAHRFFQQPSAEAGRGVIGSRRRSPVAVSGKGGRQSEPARVCPKGLGDATSSGS